MFKRERDVEGKQIAEGVLRKVLNYNDELMVCSFELKKGASVPIHNHPHLSYIISGKMKFIIGDNLYEVEACDNLFIEKDVPHTAEALEDSKVIEIFMPMRKDFL